MTGDSDTLSGLFWQPLKAVRHLAALLFCRLVASSVLKSPGLLSDAYTVAAAASGFTSKAIPS